MMNTSTLTSIFEPNELAFLQRLFNDLCAARKVAGGSVGANDLAARIINLYQQGVRDEKDLHFHLGISTEPTA